MLTPLFFLFLISATGGILYFFKKINRFILNLLIALGAGSMLSVAIVHILPESLEGNPHAIYAFMCGFLVIYLIEELLTPHDHDHSHGDHSHEDPHEHYDHVALVTFIAIFIHTLFDGLGIRAGFSISPALGYSVLAAVAIHQIPVSLSLAAIFQESKFKRKMQIIFILIFAGAAPIGFWLSDILLAHTEGVFAPIATAFAGGSLLYVAATDLLPVVHGQTHKKYLSVVIFMLGALAMMVVKFFE